MNIALHLVDDALADGQAQTRAAKFAGDRCIGLGKGREQSLDLLLADPNASVLNRDIDPDL